MFGFRKRDKTQPIKRQRPEKMDRYYSAGTASSVLHTWTTRAQTADEITYRYAAYLLARSREQYANKMVAVMQQASNYYRRK